jgi:hypothetical protein
MSHRSKLRRKQRERTAAAIEAGTWKPKPKPKPKLRSKSPASPSHGYTECPGMPPRLLLEAYSIRLPGDVTISSYCADRFSEVDPSLGFKSQQTTENTNAALSAENQTHENAIRSRKRGDPSAICQDTHADR